MNETRRRLSLALLGGGLGAVVRPGLAGESGPGEGPLALHDNTLALIRGVFGSAAAVETEKLAFDLSGYARRGERHYVERGDRVPIRLGFDGLAPEGPVCIVMELSTGDYAGDGGYRREPAFYLESRLVASVRPGPGLTALEFTGRAWETPWQAPCGATWIHVVALARDGGRLVFRSQKLVAGVSCGPGG